MNKKRRTYTIVSLLVVALLLHLLGGCATVFKGTHKMVDIGSNPLGAKVYVNGMYKGTTPVNLVLQTNKTYTIEFRKEGYETSTFTISNHIGAGWVILDIIFGLVPVIVDAVTGAWFVLDQDSVNAALIKQQ